MCKGITVRTERKITLGLLKPKKEEKVKPKEKREPVAA